MPPSILNGALAAKASGARITFSCGFDSIPFDLGVLFLQAEAVKRHGKPAPRVKGRVRKMAGGASGGTVASLTETLKAVAKKPSLALLLKSSFALTPGFEGPSQPTGLIPEYDGATGTWTAPTTTSPARRGRSPSAGAAPSATCGGSAPTPPG